MSDTSQGDSFSQLWPADSTSDFGRTAFLVRRMMALTRTMVPVKIIKVLKQDGKTQAVQGEVAGAGYVQVQPLVSQIDGAGKVTKHTTIYNIPYTRMYGGINSNIVDPIVGDVGYMQVADRDISSFKSASAGKSNPDPSNPGSFRRFDLADGIYIGGVLNPKPKQYLTFTKTGATIADQNGNKTVWDKSGALGSGDAITNTGVQGILHQDMNGSKLEMRKGDQSTVNGIRLTDYTSNVIDMAPAGTSRTSPNSITDTAPSIGHVGNTSITGTLGVTQLVTALGYNTSSDISLKSDIVPLTDVLDQLMQVRLYSYTIGGRTTIGVIAQQLQKIFPQLVGGEDVLWIHESKLALLAIPALQRLVERITVLEHRIDELEHGR